jgi:hypothetical protein
MKISIVDYHASEESPSLLPSPVEGEGAKDVITMRLALKTFQIASKKIPLVPPFSKGEKILPPV